MRDGDDRHALIDLQPVAFEADELPRIVRDRPDRFEPQIQKNLRADAVVAEVGREAKTLVGFDRVDSLILKLIRLQLVEEADSAALLIEVDDHALPLFGDHLHRSVQLPTAIAAEGMEDVSGETFRVHSHEHARIRLDASKHESDVLVIVDIIFVTDNTPSPDFRRKPSFGDTMHEALGLQPMCDELGDSDEGEAVLLCETLELGTASARAVLAEDLADYSRGNESGQPGKIDGCFSVPHALEHSSLPRSKGRDVSRAAQIGGNSFGIDGNPDRLCAILGAHSRRDAESLIGINADGESGTIFLGVDFTLLSELQLVGALSRERETYPPARFADHEVDHLGGDQLRRANQVALILAILIVRDDDQLTGLDVGNSLLDSSELHSS